MGSLWNFFGLPDPEGGTPEPRPQPNPAEQRPVSLSASPEPNAPSEPAVEATVPPARRQPNISGLRTPPLGWNGPVTPDGEPFHDLGVAVERRPPPPNKALRYIAPDVMKRIPTRSMLERVMQGDTAIVDLRSLVHMESHQMACRRDIKHMADQARVSVFSLDAEDKLLMIPGQNVVVDMHKHELGLTPLL
ncbi:MAG: hypothetical protein VW982_02250 [Candidatus Poseidoniales archaeon]|jgi:hypothetical protein